MNVETDIQFVSEQNGVTLAEAESQFEGHKQISIISIPLH